MNNSTPNNNDKTKAAMNAAVAKRQPTAADVLCKNLASPSVLASLKNALPAQLTSPEEAARYSRILMTLVRLTPSLASCSINTVLAGALTGAALGLDPTPGLDEFYLVPYGGKATFQMGYKGMMKLAYQGDCQKISAHKVCEHDIFDIEYGLEETLKHKPCLSGPRGDVIGYYVTVVLRNGEKTFLYLTKPEVMEHALKKSKAYKSGPWQTDFDAMALKTCLRLLFKWLPKNTRLAQAINRDETVSHVNDINEVTRDEILETAPEQITIEEEDAVETNFAGSEVHPVSEDEPLRPKGGASELDRLDIELDELFGDGGLGLNQNEQNKFIANTLGLKKIEESDRTPANMKRVIEAAKAVIRDREA